MTDHSATPAEEVGAVTEATREEEQREAMMPADAGSDPTPEESAAADQHRVDPLVAKSNKEAMERGANVRGEGQIP